MGCVDGPPAGWISFGPRQDHTKLALARITKPVKEREVWSSYAPASPGNTAVRAFNTVVGRWPTRVVMRGWPAPLSTSS